MPPIPPVIIWTVGAVAAVTLARIAVKEWRRVNEALHPWKTAPVNDEVAREKLPTLRRDPRTGIYRVD